MDDQADDELGDPVRFPVLSPAGRRMLAFLHDHPNAPIYRNRSGPRLTATDIDAVRAFEADVLAARIDWPRDAQGAFTEPPWLRAFLDRALAVVPFYRRYDRAGAALTMLPTISRADLSRDVAQFVPDDLPLARLMHFQTSGTTGHPLLVPSHPLVAARYLAFHKRALARFGIALTHGAGQVGVVLVGAQQKCFTYVSVTPTMDESGLAKINLHPNDWRDPADRAPYFDALAAEVVTGDPLSLDALAALPVTHRPRAMLSTSMALLPGQRARLEARFGCSVIDLYSLNEAGPVAVADPQAGGHVLLQPRLYVELLDSEGQRVAPGARGEVTLTGGFNDYLPLIRYRTGDTAALGRAADGTPLLVGLEGRPPVRFRTLAGEWVNNVDVTHALAPFAIAQYALHQDASGAFTLRLAGAADARGVRLALERLLGSGVAIDIQLGARFDGKVVQYTSDLTGANP